MVDAGWATVEVEIGRADEVVVRRVEEDCNDVRLACCRIHRLRPSPRRTPRSSNSTGRAEARRRQGRARRSMRGIKSRQNRTFHDCELVTHGSQVRVPSESVMKHWKVLEKQGLKV